MARTYDQRCYALAEAFLTDCPDICTEAAKITMAQQIQQTIEDEIDFMRMIERSIEGKVS